MSSNKTARESASADAIDSARDELAELALDIHAHPELNYQEFYSSALLTGTLEQHGFAVERGVGGVETAFRASLSGGAGAGPTVAILAEYDALPEIGHGCGHNLIAMAAVGAGLGLQANIQSLPGRVVVLGRRPKKGGGGKIRLLDAGVFDGIDVVLSSHPSSNRTVIPLDTPQGESWSLAMVGYRYEFHGKAAHAAAAPEAGVNALNAVIHFFTGIDAMRQHLREDRADTWNHHRRWESAQRRPEYAAANFMLRCRDRNYLSDVVVDRVRFVAEGAATMTEARLEVSEFYPFYENVRPNSVVARTLRANAERVGLYLDQQLPSRQGSAASTDFGNVSQALPAFELRYAVSEQPVPSHTREMAEVATTDFACSKAISVAKALSLTACDFLEDAEAVAAARKDFAARGPQTS